MKYAKYRILVIDDERIHRVSLNSIIKKSFNCTVWEADSPLLAFEIIKRSIPDVIVLDIQMPHMNGYEALRRIREARLSRHIPVLVCTARTQSNLVTDLMRLGISGYIVKPFDKDLVAAKLLAIFNKLEEEKEHRKTQRDNTLPQPQSTEQMPATQNISDKEE